MRNKNANIELYKGFTLAEVLITLVVIGVIASLTIPALIPKTNDAELRAALKKSYGELSQAISRLAQDKGPLSELVGTRGLRANIMPYLSIIRDCGWSTCVPAGGNYYKTYAGDRYIYTTWIDDGQLVLNNGMTIFIENPSGASQGMLISVDVNGYQKPPNIWGKDLFTFQIIDDHLRPAGIEGSIPIVDFTDFDTYCSKTSTSRFNGASCTVFALADRDY